MKNKGDISQEAKYALFISPYFIDGLEISPVLGLKLHKMKKKDSVSEGSKALVILIRLTSKRPCQDWGWGGSRSTPPIYLGSGANFDSEIMFS